VIINTLPFIIDPLPLLIDDNGRSTINSLFSAISSTSALSSSSSASASSSLNSVLEKPVFCISNIIYD
jgi:hypothetical protein